MGVGAGVGVDVGVGALRFWVKWNAGRRQQAAQLWSGLGRDAAARLRRTACGLRPDGGVAPGGGAPAPRLCVWGSSTSRGAAPGGGGAPCAEQAPR